MEPYQTRCRAASDELVAIFYSEKLLKLPARINSHSIPLELDFVWPYERVLKLRKFITRAKGVYYSIKLVFCY